MIKITTDTTMFELTLLRVRLGVQRMVIDYDYTGHYAKCVRVVLFGQFYEDRNEEVQVVGQGTTEIAALDDAFGRLWHLETRRILDMPVAPA